MTFIPHTFPATLPTVGCTIVTHLITPDYGGVPRRCPLPTRPTRLPTPLPVVTPFVLLTTHNTFG